jgi:16S rRNA processing protein RimM
VGPDDPPGTSRRRWLRAGRVGRPHGLDGSFHVADPNPVLLEQDASVVIGERSLRIVRRAGADRRPIVRLAGVDDRSAADALRGQEMLVQPLGAPELAPDEWWPDELEGCAVRDRQQHVGTVRRLLLLPSVDVLEVARADGGDDLLVPLVSDAVRTVDPERKEIDIDLAFLGEQ